jgi:CRISPR system Cascade subunit CasA
MNLLTDNWIPVWDGTRFRHINFQDTLCRENDWKLELNRDDLNLAALQLLISLTQVIFSPADKRELRNRESEPMSAADFAAGVSPFLDWFDIRHKTFPFMQSNGIVAKEPTPIQKLFPGLPEGNNHAFFNEPGEITAICEGCAAVALFNQATACPSFGGGFKGSLRGSAPITTLVSGATLRQTIWRNVLLKEALSDIYATPGVNDKPTWVDPIKKDESISAARIGPLRGLFWQPAHIALGGWTHGDCLCCGRRDTPLITSFDKEKFTFTVVGTWAHPHSPKVWKEKKGALEEKYASFTTTAPAWTHLATMVAQHADKKEGYACAPTVSQFRNVFEGESLNLIVGGYRNNQASILERRHELLSLAQGWDENLEHVRRMIELAADVKTILRGKTYGFGKQIGLDDLAQRAEQRFYQASESNIHQILRRMNWREKGVARRTFLDKLCNLAEEIFDDLVEPYQTAPKMLRAAVLSRRSLKKELNRLAEGETNDRPN